jgi:hypothetical protein
VARAQLSGMDCRLVSIEAFPQPRRLFQPPSIWLPSTLRANFLITYATIGESTAEMRSIGFLLLNRWYGMLGLARQSPKSWYRDRIREELRERHTANTPWQKLSETSDVFFSISRAQYDGVPVRKLPVFVPRHVPVYAYMFVKYTLRWKFYRTAAALCQAPQYELVCEVVNPSKDHKLDEVAFRHQIDPVKFQRVTRRLRQVWPLLS